MYSNTLPRLWKPLGRRSTHDTPFRPDRTSAGSESRTPVWMSA